MNEPKHLIKGKGVYSKEVIEGTSWSLSRVVVFALLFAHGRKSRYSLIPLFSESHSDRKSMKAPNGNQWQHQTWLSVAAGDFLHESTECRSSLFQIHEHLQVLTLLGT